MQMLPVFLVCTIPVAFDSPVGLGRVNKIQQSNVSFSQMVDFFNVSVG